MSQIGKQQCGCCKHEEFVKDNSFSRRKIEQRPYKRAIIDALISNNLLTPKSKYLCDISADEGSKLIKPCVSDEALKAKRIRLSNAVDIVVDEIESGNVKVDQMCKLASALGASQRDK